METVVENKAGFKKTKVGWIPEDWRLKKLEEVCTLFNGKAYKQSELLENGKYKVLRVGNFFTKGDWYFSDLELDENKYVKKGDLMYAWSASFGPKLWDGDKTIYHYHIWKVVPNQKIEKRFLYHYFIYDKYKLMQTKQGGTMFHITKGDMERRPIVLPPMQEQIKISAILNTWETSITDTQNLIQQLKLRKKGLMQQLLTGKKRLSGFDEDWKIRPLGDFIAKEVRPVQKPSSNYLALGLRSHGKGIFHKPDFEPESISMDTLYEVKENDLVVNITFAWEHAIAVADEKDVGGLVSHRFPTYTFKVGVSDATFFRYFVLQPRFKYELGVISPGGAGRNRVMSKKDFPLIPVQVPEYKEQVEIGKILDSVDSEITLHQSKLEELEKQKKGLMQQLLTGQKRVSIN